MAKPERPTLPFTLHGQRHLIGCALLVAAFLFALALYLQWGRVRDLRATLATPLPSTLANDLLSVTPDPAWGAYAFVRGGDTQAILLRERPEGPGAVVVLQALRAPELAVRALDVSPAVLAVKLTASYAAVLGKETSVKLLGSETRPHRSGVTAAHFFFDAEDEHGEGIFFYVGDVEYLFWGLRGGPGSPSLAPFLAAVGGAAETRATLLWRAGKERLCHAAPLNDGRNVIAWLPDRSAPALNPAIPGNRIDDLFLEGDGLTLVVEDPEGGTSQRLTFAFGDRFAIGPFTGLALPTAEAERALKTRDPLAWPDRRVRLLLRVAVCVGLLLALAMAALAREPQTLRQAVAARAPAAVEIAVPAPAPTDPLSRDTIVAYGQLFHACLPGLLATPEATTTGDLLAMRAGQLLRALPEEAAERVPLRRKQVFLESLATIKRAVAAGDWPRLGDALATVDADALHYYDGDGLLADARALARTFGQDYSALCRELLRGGGGLAAVEPRRQALRDALGGNRFRGLPVVADRLDALDRHWAALVAWHCAVRGFGGGAGGADEVDAYDSKGLLRADLYALEDATAALGDPALDRLLQEERQSLAKALAARIDGLCGKDGPGTPADIGSLRALARLGRAVATPDALAAARRADGFAATLSADYDRTCRDLLTRYRLERLAGNAAAAEAILGELLALGPADSPFWDWARRERARTAPNEEPQP